MPPKQSPREPNHRPPQPPPPTLHEDDSFSFFLSSSLKYWERAKDQNGRLGVVWRLTLETPMKGVEETLPVLGLGSLYRQVLSLLNSKSTSRSWLWAHSPCFTPDISVFYASLTHFQASLMGSVINFPLLGSSIPYFCSWYSISKYFSFSILLISLVSNFKIHFVSFLIIIIIIFIRTGLLLPNWLHFPLLKSIFVLPELIVWGTGEFFSDFC